MAPEAAAATSDDDQRSLIKKFLRLRGKQKSDEFETFLSHVLLVIMLDIALMKIIPLLFKYYKHFSIFEDSLLLMQYEV